MTSSIVQPTAVIYCRVSSKDQVDGTSLESQERYCREWADRQGIRVVCVFVDKGESAKTADRSEFIKAISFCAQKRNGVKYFIVHKIDRFARSQDDHVSVRATLRRYGVELRSATEPIDETPVGKAMEGMISVFAEFDNNVRRERCVSGMLERIRQGVWVWGAPLGYQRQTRGGPLVPDPTLAPFIRLVFEEWAKGGYTYASLAAFLAERGMRTRSGKRPSMQLVQHILTNPIYCGIMEVWGERQVGKFEPLISVELFERCQPQHRAVADPRPARIRYNPAFPLRRVVCTTCGGRLTGSFCRSRSGRRYPYYHHQKQGCDRATFVPKAHLESVFVSYLESVATKAGFEKLFARLVSDKWREIMRDSQHERGRIEREMESLRGERQRIFEFHRSGQYTDEEFREQREVVARRLLERQAALDRVDVSDFSLDAALRDCLRLTRETALLWQQSTPGWRLRFQSLVFVGGEMRFDGIDFSNSPLTSIYQLNREFCTSPSTWVHHVGELWNQLLEDINACAESLREYKEAERTARSEQPEAA
jgi:DNA invertase Pin-like site-specific DNA recombinase